MKRVVPGVNGVKGVPGIQGGFMVATYNGVPIIPSKDVKKDAAAVCISLTQITVGSQRLNQHCITSLELKQATHSVLTA